jgi:hypothetical protein
MLPRPNALASFAHVPINTNQLYHLTEGGMHPKLTLGAMETPLLCSALEEKDACNTT